MSKLFKVDTKLAQDIDTFICIGAGNMTDFSVNDGVVHKFIAWKTSCVVDPTYGGLVCDNELLIPFPHGSVWTASVVNAFGDLLSSGTSSGSVWTVDTINSNVLQDHQVSE